MSRAIDPDWSHGMAFCPKCENNLCQEEIDFLSCFACGGEGFPEADDDLADWMMGEHP